LTRKTNSLLHDYKLRPKKDKHNRKFRFSGIVIVSLFLIIISSPWSWQLEKIEDTKTNTRSTETKNEKIPTAINKTKKAEKETASKKDLTVAPDSELQKIEITIRQGDTLEELFKKNDLSLGDLIKITNIDTLTQDLKYLRPGDTLTLTHNDNQVISLIRNLSLKKALLIEKENNQFKSSLINRNTKIKKRFGYGKIKTSLFDSAIESGLTEKLIMNLADILAWDIDFVYDIRVDDDFYVLFEEIWQDNRYITDGEIIALEFNNNGRTYQAIRYIDKNGLSNYFTPEGNNMSKAFLRAPLDFTRVSSNFNPNRKHPILNTIRAHRGVDYAAPKGTKIKASGNGKITFKGVKSGYGNVIILQHGDNITTLYAHMSDFNSTLKTGQRVEQNQVIGYVGSSGLATAPHLHYEYRIDGIHKNPRTVELPQAKPIQNEYKEDFLMKSGSIINELTYYKESRLLSVSSSN